jgi:NDP-sugar pyrophosphorylase family protein
MLVAHRKHSGKATVLTTKVDKEQANKYGCVVNDPETNEVLHFVNKPGELFSYWLLLFPTTTNRDSRKLTVKLCRS